LRGNVVSLLSGAQRRSRRRGQDTTLIIDDVLDMLLTQAGRCYYSGVPMECLLPNSDWRMSLERLNNELGYSMDNSVLVAGEFNTPDWSRNNAVYDVYGTAQWSQEKVDFVWGAPQNYVQRKALLERGCHARCGLHGQTRTASALHRTCAQAQQCLNAQYVAPREKQRLPMSQLGSLAGTLPDSSKQQCVSYSVCHQRASFITW